MNTVSVARDFTRFPAGRYIRNGDTSGEAFRGKFLVGPIRAGEPVLVDLDGTVGYGSSFLEEAFGGLVRELKLPAGEILRLLKFKSEDQGLVEEVTQYIQDAGLALKQG